MLVLKSRLATESDIEKPSVVRRSCGATRTVVASDHADKVLKKMWAYHESCGYANPEKRVKRGLDYLMGV